ncbi:MAG: HlyD family type I secretion periplasmic adaptor subunit, partial [Bauldia sp.]
IATPPPQLGARAEAPPPPSDSARGAVGAGFAILLVFFGGFGAWALTAPLNGAVVGNAVVKVEGNRKSVQHLDGGIVRQIRVREGDRVEKDDVLLVLDDTQTRAEVDVLTEQRTTLLAVEARLAAELEGRATIVFPPVLLARSDSSATAAIDGQIAEFEGRRAALEGEQQVLIERIAQQRAGIAGNDAQKATYQEQLDSVIGEKKSLKGLLDKELIPRARMLQLDRTEAGIRGQLAEMDAATAQARQAIAELSGQIALLGKDRAADISSSLRETRSKLLDIAPRLDNALASLERTIVRAPYDGTVVGLSVFSVDGVIGRGERLLEIVPDATSLVVEAEISVEDIADVRPGMRAEVQFTSYKQRTTPLIHGTVTEISADRLTDERTGLSHYKALVAVDREDMAASPQIKLYPGMSATVMITTEERTAFDYLVGPLAASFHRAFRER